MRPTSLGLLFASATMLFAVTASAQVPPPGAPVPYMAPAAGYAPPPYYGYYPPPPQWGAPATVFVDPDAGGTERRSPAMMITGFTMAGIGVGAIITGAFFYAAMSSIQYDIQCIQAPCGGYDTSKPVGGPIAAMVSGGVLLAVGLPVGIVGATKKKKVEPAASAVPEVNVGATSAKLRWSF